MRVSVIVPVYNHAPFVEATIRSVAEQGWPDTELVLIDDGSSDDSAERVEAALTTHGDRFSRVDFQGQSNQGIVATLNRLVERSTGEFVLPLASDDYLLPGAIHHRVQELVQHPGALAVFTDCVVIDAEGSEIYASGIRDIHGGNLEQLASNRMMATSLILRWSVPGPCMLVRREAYGASGVGPYDPELPAEDFSFYLRLANTGRLRFSPRPTAAYRLMNTSAMHSFTEEWDSIYCRTIERCLPTLQGATWWTAMSVLAQHRWPPGTGRFRPERLFWAGVGRAVRAVHRRATTAEPLAPTRP